MAGFAFEETLTGSLHFLDPGGSRVRLPASSIARPMSITLQGRFAGSSPFRAGEPPGAVEIAGEVGVEGFADRRPLRGSIELAVDAEWACRVLRYAFDFLADDGLAYAFDGTRRLVTREIATSIAILPGTIRGSTGGDVARALLRFDLRSGLVGLLRSVRVWA